MATVRPSDFLTKADIIQSSIIPGMKEQWALAYQEAVNKQKTADGKAAVRLEMLKLLENEVKLYQEEAAKVKASYVKAVQEGTVEAWKQQRARELAQFKNESTIRMHNSSELGAASRSAAHNKAIQGKQAQADTYEQHKANVLQNKTYWNDAVKHQSSGGAGDVLDVAIDGFVGNVKNQTPGNDARLRRAVRHLYELEGQTGTPAGGPPSTLIVDKIYQNIPDPETRARAVDVVTDELSKLDTVGPTPFEGDPSDPQSQQLDTRAAEFLETAALRDSFDWKKEDFEKAKGVGGGGTPKAYLVKPEALNPSTTLGPSEQAMLDASLPGDPQSIIDEYERLEALARRGMAEQTSELGKYLQDDSLPLDTARDIYHTRFGTQKARPQVLNDQLRRLTPAELVELQELARAKRNPAPPIDASQIYQGLMKQEPDLKVPVPMDPAVYGAGPAPEPPKPKPQRPWKIEPGTQLPPPTETQPKTPVGKAPDINQLKATHSTAVLSAMERGRELASKDRKLRRLLQTTPVGKAIGSLYAIDSRNNTPLEKQIDNLVSAYRNSPTDQAQALEILFALRTQSKTNKLIKESV